MYGLLPILRNTIAGLNSVDAPTLDAARGIGMGRFRILWQIELPLAWPVILAGIRVSGQLIVGLVAIGAYVGVTGLGEMLFNALQNLGSVNTFNQAVAGTVLVAIIALLLDAASSSSAASRPRRGSVSESAATTSTTRLDRRAWRQGKPAASRSCSTGSPSATRGPTAPPSTTSTSTSHPATS